MARRALRRASAGLAATLLAAIAALPASPAVAGDAALLDIIGYSDDGRYFAFEEYGIQDGSGFAYSSIYIVDLPADKWMYGSPFHAQADDSEWDRPLAEVRAEARADAAGRLKELGIDTPAQILILLGDGVPNADGKMMRFSNPRWGPPGSTEDGDYALTLETFPAESPNECEGLIGDKALGFALIYAQPGDTSIVHRDGATIPRSRGCPVDYRLYAVVERFEAGGSRVAIVSSYPFGFEGADRRFIAVPLSYAP